MNRIVTICIFLFILLKGNAQRIPRIGLLAPLMLDSVFHDGEFRYEKTFPKFIVPGLDFIQGAQIALDSLSSMGIRSKVYVMDSKSNTAVAEMIEQGKLDVLDLIIAAVKEPEYSTLAEFARSKKIPLISAVYPNDGGIKNNPYLVIMNPTLKTHCANIFSQLLLEHTEKGRIFLVNQAGSQEDKIAAYLKDINEQDGKPLLKMQQVRIDSNYDVLTNKLDTLHNAMIIGGSLDETFAGNLISALGKLNKKYKIKLYGMPNWDGFEIVRKGKTKGLPIYYTSAYFNEKSDSCSKYLQRRYEEQYKGLPSDAAYKGFEYSFYFLKLYSKYGNEMMEHLNDSNGSMFSEFIFLPVHASDVRVTDYYENKHLFLLKSLNGKSDLAK